MTGFQLILVMLAGWASLNWLRNFLPPPWGIAVEGYQTICVAIFVPLCVVAFIGFKGF